MNDVPTDMLLLLGKIDGKIESVQQTLNQITSQLNNHDSRLSAVENDITAIKTDRAAMIPPYMDMRKEHDELMDWKTEMGAHRKSLILIFSVISGVLTSVGWAVEHWHIFGA